MKQTLTSGLVLLAVSGLQAATVFSENFDSATIGSTSIAGWTFFDAPTAGDHPSIGVRASGNASGGPVVTTLSGTGNFLNGGRSAIFSAKVGGIVDGMTYTFTLRSRDVGSSYANSAAYFTSALPTGYVAEVNTLGGFAATTGASIVNSWQEYRVAYTGTALTQGLDLFINLQSSRDISTGVRGWDDITVTAVPEPSTYGLWAAVALAGIARARRRRADLV